MMIKSIGLTTCDGKNYEIYDPNMDDFKHTVLSAIAACFNREDDLYEDDISSADYIYSLKVNDQTFTFVHHNRPYISTDLYVDKYKVCVIGRGCDDSNHDAIFFDQIDNDFYKELFVENKSFNEKECDVCSQSDFGWLHINLQI